MKNKSAIEKLKLMEGIAWRCICNVHYFNLTSGHKGRCWSIIQNAIGESACLFWSHLFGSRGDHFHYSTFFGLDEVIQTDSNFSVESVKSRLMNHVKMNDSQYSEFWKEVKSCRDQFVAHRDNKIEGLIFPRIDLCKNMAEELRIIFSELVCKWFNEYPNDSEIESLKSYYEWNPNDKFEIMCERDFRDGVISLSKEFS
jgi:hypothetical protein